MRKAVCALLIGVMACSMVACGGKDLPAEGSEVTGSSQAVSSEESNTANPLFDNLVRSWNARTFTASDGTNLPFQLYMPPEYDAAKSYPCILYMHSAGVKCDDNSHIYKGEAKFLRNLENGKYAKEAIVIAPCCPEGPEMGAGQFMEPDHVRFCEYRACPVYEGDHGTLRDRQRGSFDRRPETLSVRYEHGRFCRLGYPHQKSGYVCSGHPRCGAEIRARPLPLAERPSGYFTAPRTKRCPRRARTRWWRRSKRPAGRISDTRYLRGRVTASGR